MNKSTNIHMPKKMVSFLMALLIISASIPFAFAATPTTLSASNVVSYPTVKGTIYYGQIIGEALTLEGGEVQYNGMKVEGEFQFSDPTKRQTSIGNSIRSDIIFVPANSQDFTGFSERRSKNVTYQALKPTPVFSDSNNLPKVEGVVESGVMLSTITINGGQVMNPYYPEETNATSAKWEWADPTKVVIESGLYEAVINPINYESLTCNIQINVESPLAVTEISELPFIEEINYSSEQKWGQITINGGTVVVKDTDTVVEGVFAVTDLWKNVTPKAGSYEVDVIFTPNNTEAYTQVECKIPVTVNKAPIRFVDENGDDIVPEITVPYGTKFNDISRLLRPFVKGADYTYFVMGDLSSKVCEDGTYTVKATAPDDGANYEDTDLTFKIVVEKKKLNPKLYSASGKLYINDNSAVYHPTGTFTLEYTIDGVEQTPITGIKYNTHFDWNPTKSGNYEYTIIYNEAAEKEYFIIDDFTTNSTIALTWGFKATGSVEGTTYKYGSEVALEAPATDPTKEDKPFYGFVKWEDANGNTGLTEEELSNREISFTMPDGDVELNATYKFDFCLCIRYYIQIVVDWFNSFFQSIGTLF